MKSTTTFKNLTYLLFSACIFASCSKSNSTSSSPAPTEADAVNAVSSSMDIGSGGFTDQIGAASSMSYSSGVGRPINHTGIASLTCGGPAFDTTFTLSYNGTNVTATYQHTWDFQLDCPNDALDFTGTFTGTYSGPYLSGSRSGTRTWAMTGFDSTISYFTFNGSFNCTGTWTMKVRNKNSITNNITITGVNVTVDKATSRITGGTGTVTVVSAVSNGNSYNFNGTVVFNGDHTATLTINGNTYTIYI